MWCKRTCSSFEAALHPLSYHAPQEIHISHVESQIFTGSYNMPGPVIELRATSWHADVLTTTLPRLSVYDHFGSRSVQSCCSYVPVLRVFFFCSLLPCRIPMATLLLYIVWQNCYNYYCFAGHWAHLIWNLGLHSHHRYGHPCFI